MSGEEFGMNESTSEFSKSIAESDMEHGHD